VQLTVGSEKELHGATLEMIQFATDQKIWLFYGEMGSGKTTIIKEIAHAFGVEDMVQSPTFSIVNEYRNSEDDIFYHFDFYRIAKESEARDIGVDEYLDSGAYCFIEWPQKIPNLVPVQHLQIEIEITSETSRKINLKHHGK
jgi:tRNA threonylcarbamoyladenosine biosynthesis protein TsaE